MNNSNAVSTKGIESSQSFFRRLFDGTRRRLQKRDIQRMLVNLGIIAIVGSYVHFRTGLFWTTHNWLAISVQIVVVTMIACGMTLVMMAGHIDASIAGIVVLCGIVAGLFIKSGVPIPFAFLLATLVGASVGLLNAFLVLGVGITSMIATIGVLYMTQGLANLLTNGLPIAGLPPGFRTVGGGSIFGIPIAVPMIILVTALFISIQRFTLFGRWVIATGSNSKAAFLTGVNVRLTTIGVFVLTGAAAGWGGVVYASRLGNPSPQLDNALLFQVIVAVVIGGTSLFGGEGSVSGTLIASVLIGVLNNGLNLLGISTFWQYITLGLLLIGSVGSDTVLRHGNLNTLRRRIRDLGGMTDELAAG